MLGYGAIGQYTVGQISAPIISGPSCITLGAVNFDCITIFLIGSSLLSWII